MCVGPPTSSRFQGKVNISWDPLPCHLQNGADVDYIIHYTHLSTGVSTNISSSDSRLLCRQEPGDPYSCLAHDSLFTLGVAYSFQVAAQSVRGVGSFSNLVISVYGSNGKHNKLVRQVIIIINSIIIIILLLQ